ncbi:TIGR03862 family flavoprotein [Amylibacter sp. SFDW26]|uniref:TIGR03862 family flavoprotein n=1 Tax=Amylibacter sp. SFDW26 TaxID=2652722 RepID=UPI0012619429|nr:TIGR03862 family flavoprotein [Amylibacter sp. SFDW26]KAB7614468.1 TIGR03862 family flavoprotein [Amylibacter sp. SFDW26]
MIDLCVIGAGPAGLMAAEVVADAGLSVLVIDAKPSFGRKFLMAGKSGLNLTKNEPFDVFTANYDEAEPWLRPMLSEFTNTDVCTWAQSLGQEVFTGSSGRVFPKSMKASPLLRAWLLRLSEKGVQFKTRWRWTGWDKTDLKFNTPEGIETINAKTTVLALGGASWANLGSDGKWSDILSNEGIAIHPFKPANMGFIIPWSHHMQPHFGTPVKTITLQAGTKTIRGDFVISAKGIEGSAIYAASKYIRKGAPLVIDLLPDHSEEQLQSRLLQRKTKASRSSVLRKALHLDPVKAALINEFYTKTPIQDLPKIIKSFHIPHNGPRPMDEAISTAGGIPQSALTEGLMLKDKPSVFCAGEMLDWEAPTGGYLITGCLATGRCAGQSAVTYLTA